VLRRARLCATPEELAPTPEVLAVAPELAGTPPVSAAPLAEPLPARSGTVGR